MKISIEAWLLIGISVVGVCGNKAKSDPFDVPKFRKNAMSVVEDLNKALSLFRDSISEKAKLVPIVGAELGRAVETLYSNMGSLSEDCDGTGADDGYAVSTLFKELIYNFDEVSNFYDQLAEDNSPTLQGKCASETFIRWVVDNPILAKSALTIMTKSTRIAGHLAKIRDEL